MSAIPFSRLLIPIAVALALLPTSSQASAGKAYVRVDQVGYVVHQKTRAFVMSTLPETGATVQLLDHTGAVVSSTPLTSYGRVWYRPYTGAQSWYVYRLGVMVPHSDTYILVVSGGTPPTATSPPFRVDTAANLYAIALSHGREFFQNQRDGADYVTSTLRKAPGHLNDTSATVYLPPVLAGGGDPRPGLVASGAVIDASGGWWDDGGYMKFVETHSFSVATMLMGIRDFPAQMGATGPTNFSGEAKFGLDWLQHMWDDSGSTLYMQVGVRKFSDNTKADGDLWRRPEVDDTYKTGVLQDRYIRNRPVFYAAPSGAAISPNLAGRMSAAFALCYQVLRVSNPTYANQCLLEAEHIYDLADTAPSGPLQTAVPYSLFPETEWRDDMEWGATELYLALHAGGASLPAGLPHTNASAYLTSAASWANAYINGPGNGADSLGLYDVSALAHFDLYRAMTLAGSPSGLAVTQAQLLGNLQQQVHAAETTASTEPFYFANGWNGSDSVPHGIGLAVTASEVASLTGDATSLGDASHWLHNVLGANAWGISFVVGDGAYFIECPRHQVANLNGLLNGGEPSLHGAVVAGPTLQSGDQRVTVTGMRTCPTGGDFVDYLLDGDGAWFTDDVAISLATTPSIDRTAPSLLMFAWQIAGGVAALP